MIEEGLEKYYSLIIKSWENQDFDHLSFALIDFKKKSYTDFTLIDHELVTDEKVFFDLASLTKPLTLAAYFHLNPQKITPELKLLLEHRAGLKAWGRLGSSDWKEQLLSYNLKESEATYSDFSALRLMLEIEKREGQTLENLVADIYDSELLFWKNLNLSHHCPATGWRRGQRIINEVNDDNCFNINRFCSHAGLFATVAGLCQTLLNLEERTSFIEVMNQSYTHRFLNGWDRVTSSDSLAGQGCGAHTFGHLGFTGTSMWIDPESKKGWVLLTNATKEYWFHRHELNKLRRELGQLVWKS